MLSDNCNGRGRGRVGRKEGAAIFRSGEGKGEHRSEGDEGGSSAAIWGQNVAGRWGRCYGGSLPGTFTEQLGGQCG